jgi:hypothetical protein
VGGRRQAAAGGRREGTLTTGQGAGPDGIGTALAAVSIGAAAGGALLCLILAAAHDMPRGADSRFADVALGGAAAGLSFAAAVGFALARRLGVWRAALVAMIAVSGAALVTVLTTAADIALGRTGLLLLALLCIGVIAGARRLFYAAPHAA